MTPMQSLLNHLKGIRDYYTTEDNNLSRVKISIYDDVIFNIEAMLIKEEEFSYEVLKTGFDCGVNSIMAGLWDEKDELLPIREIFENFKNQFNNDTKEFYKSDSTTEIIIGKDNCKK